MDANKKRDYMRAYYLRNKERLLAANAAHNAMRANQTRATATNSGNPWTEADDAVLLADDGRKMWEKALELGRTHRACYERRRNLLKPPPPPHEDGTTNERHEPPRRN